jgi:hypothetical protein
MADIQVEKDLSKRCMPADSIATSCTEDITPVTLHENAKSLDHLFEGLRA